MTQQCIIFTLAHEHATTRNAHVTSHRIETSDALEIRGIQSGKQFHAQTIIN